MPVVTLYLDRLKRLIEDQVSMDAVIEKIPYLGLDLEEVAEDHLRVEYNPNRPDFSTEYGIARALNGLLGFETRGPEYNLSDSGIRVSVDRSVKRVRPYIVSLIVTDLNLDDESIRQIITMQEDIHNGIGRKRRKVSIGIHNLDVVKPPIRYTTAPQDFKFIPLGENKATSMQNIIDKTDVGREYGRIVAGFKRYPILTDSTGEVLSFPPIINGELTRVTNSTKNLFIDITATDLRTSEDALAILAATFYDAGGTLKTVKVEYPDRILITPDLEPSKGKLSPRYANRLLGLNLTETELVKCLGRCRISASPENGLLKVIIPRYRIDVLHEVDLVEEVAIGYGIERFIPTLPASTIIGRLKEDQMILTLVRETLIALGLIETVRFSLTSDNVNNRYIGRRLSSTVLKVQSPKSSEYEVLRDWLIPSIMATLSVNIHEAYPQRIFELSKTFHKDDTTSTKTREDYHVAVAFAHSDASFTEAKSCIEALLSQAFSLDCSTSPIDHHFFSEGRSAEVKTSNIVIGVIGEIRPKILANFKLRTPVSAYEIDLSKIIQSRSC